ncbi:MAG: stage II sporulation protein M [Bacilli bacterium]|nr:stage II sporulation protein M [Bacilli bacterium]
MDKLKNMVYSNKKVIVFLVGLMVIGILFGSSMPLFLSSADKDLITNYLNDFIASINNVDSLFLFKNSLINNFSCVFLIWVLGISIIGVPIVLFIFFSKCFIMGFSITSIILNYGFKGIVFSLAYIFPSVVIDILVYLVITSFSLIFSINLILYIFKKKDFNIRTSFNKYFKIFVLALFFIILISLYEAFISPVILRFVFEMLSIK